MHYLILAFSLLLTFISGYYGIKLLRLNRRISQWSRAKARITDKKVVPRKLSSGSRANWTIAVQYTFAANGLQYAGNKVSLIEFLKGEKGYLRRAADDVVAKLPEEVEIFYNPENPQESVMYADMFWMAIFLTLFCPLILLIGLAQFFT